MRSTLEAGLAVYSQEGAANVRFCGTLRLRPLAPEGRRRRGQGRKRVSRPDAAKPA